MPLSIDKEKVGPTGNIMSKGILNQLGRPDLDILAVLVREAVQNSWDARDRDNSQVFFGVNGWTLTDQQKSVLSQTIFFETPPDNSLPLKTDLACEDLNVLVLRDRGTVGLGGPTRADEITDPTEPNHFVDFLRNIGQPSDQEFTGGTYGYGKAAFYRASRSRTICVYTKCRHRGKLQSRFIAAALGYPYSDEKSKYTGRYWWGHTADGQLIEPVLDKEADQLAREIGMSGFEDAECGTSIMIINPHMGERTPLQATNLMAEYILWYFWPKMLAGHTGYPRIDFSVSWQGQQIHLPQPETYPPLRGFVEAMYHVKNPSHYVTTSFPHDYREIASQRPKQLLGHLALQQFSISKSRAFDTGSVGRAPFEHVTHHTALMRQPELVVKYLPGPESPDGNIGYGGVFISNREIDAVFADSEPPTHDDWNSSSLEERSHRVYVNQALKRTYQAMETFVEPLDASEAGISRLHPLGAFASKLGKLLLNGDDSEDWHGSILSFQQTASVAYMDSKLTDSSLPSASDNMPKLRSLDLSDDDFEAVLNDPGAQIAALDAQIQEVPHTAKNGFQVGNAVLHYVDNGVLQMYRGIPALAIKFMIEHAENSIGSLIKVSTGVVLDGNQKETNPPAGQSKPRVLGWRDSYDQEHKGKDTIFIPKDASGMHSILISMPDDVMLRVELQVAAKAPHARD